MLAYLFTDDSLLIHSSELLMISKGKHTFLPKHYLFPIPDEDVRRNPKMVQNLGWTTE